jgi:hypothetical protein
MQISPFFHNLRSAYRAELDDMRSDSEGLNILNQRLAERRGELDFLVSMLELSPEMVAVVLHKAFRFNAAVAMQQLLTHEPEDLPEWDDLVKTLEIAPWAAPLIKTLRKQAAGDWFLCVAAALEYMESQPDHAHANHASGDEEDDSDDEGGDSTDDDNEDRDDQHLSADDAGDNDGRTREEAGADWMAEQGFDRKE